MTVEPINVEVNASDPVQDQTGDFELEVEQDSPPQENLDGMADALQESMNGATPEPPLNGLPGSPSSRPVLDVVENPNEPTNAHDRPLETKLKNSNLEDLIKQCSDGIETILQYEQERRETNSEITAIREQLESVGISKKALGMALQVSKMSPDQLDGFDLAYRILRRAIGQPMQMDIFDQL